MANLARLGAFTVRQALPHLVGMPAVKTYEWLQAAYGWLQAYHADLNQLSFKAVKKATEQTWQALFMALDESSGLENWFKRLLVPGEVKGIAKNLQPLIAKLATDDDSFCRKKCQAELKGIDSEWQQAVADCRSFTDPNNVLQHSRDVMAKEASRLSGAGLHHLPELLNLEFEGEPLLLNVFNNLLGVAVTNDPELSRFVTFSTLKDILQLAQRTPFPEAQDPFPASAKDQTEQMSAEAIVHYDAHRAALEQRQWETATEALLKATILDPERFEPFPLREYKIEKILGAGGFGTAFLCKDRGLNNKVVIKTLHQATLEHDTESIFCEVQILQRLNHPAIVTTTHCEVADKGKTRPYIVMGYFDGMAFLDDYLTQHGCLDTATARQLAQKIAHGMQAAHAQGILHRDLKPANILVRKTADDWDIRIIDFGLAIKVEQINKSRMDGRPTGSLLADSAGGTYEYAAPEQMGRQPGSVGPYSDVYGFGKTLCYCLFRTTNPTRSDWHSLDKHDEALSALLSDCIEENSKRRPQDFTAVLKRLSPSRWRRYVFSILLMLLGVYVFIIPVQPLSDFIRIGSTFGTAFGDVWSNSHYQKEQRRAEERRQAEAAKRQRREAEEQARAQQALAEHLRQSARDRMLEERRQAEEAERQRREAEEQARAQQALAERLRQSARDRMLADYYDRLTAVVGRNWLLPSGIRRGLSSELLIQLDATGQVTAVQIARPSGDNAFDRAAVAAVQRTSPLPLPDNASLRADIVRSGLRFVFDPEG